MLTAYRVTAAGILILAACVPASAQDGLPYDIKCPKPATEWWGMSMASGGDVNLDGCDDLIVFDPMSQDVNGEVVGHCYMYSGKDGTLLWHADGLFNNRAYPWSDGVCGAFIGDLDGDEASEILIGIPGANSEDGCVMLLSGLTGSLIDYWLPEVHYEVMGADVAAAGDVNGDSVPDFAYIERRWEDGLVTIRSGADLSVLRSIPMQWPRHLQCAGDINGDKVDDLAVAHWCSSQCGGGLSTEVYSGQPDSEVLLTLPQPDGNLWGYGINLAAGSDITGDGVPDIAVNGHQAGDCVYLFSGSDGELVKTFVAADGEFRYMFGTDMQFADANGDGQPDLYVFGAYTAQVYNLAGDEMFFADMQWRDQPHRSYFFGNEYAIGDFNNNGCAGWAGEPGVTLVVPEYGQFVSIHGAGRLILSSHSFHDNYMENDPVFHIYGDRPARTVYLFGSRIGSGCTYVDQLGMCIDLESPLDLVGTAITRYNRWARIKVHTGLFVERGFRWLQAIDPNHPVHGPIKSNVLRVLVW